MENYMLKIKRGTATLPEIANYLKTEFRSNDYMIGFLDGYLFDNYKVLSLDEFESELNRGLQDGYYYKFVAIFDTEDAGCD